MRLAASVFCCLLCAAALTTVGHAAEPQDPSTAYYGASPPVFPISAFKDIAAYVLQIVQEKLAGKLDVQLKWVNNANEAHADLKSGAAILTYMSYDDTLSIALQENYDNVAAAWPVHGSMMNLCGTIDVSKGLVYVGIDTDTGYARMLRETLKKQMSPEDYAQIVWVYDGATNIRYEKLAAGEINATLLNEPFIYFPLPAGITCQPYYKQTGPIQGTVGNVQKSALSNKHQKKLLRTFLHAYKDATWDMKSNPTDTIKGLETFYNVTSDVATNIYNGLWGVDGIQTSFCFEPTRLANVEGIFSANTGISIPPMRWWVVNWGCPYYGAKP